MEYTRESIQKTIDFLNSKTNDFKPEVAIVLGSGLDCFCDDLEGIEIDYKDIPNFVQSSVQGHKGRLLFCKINEKDTVVMQGRVHYYEGVPISMATFPIKVFKKLGVKTLILTNASGAVHKKFNIGDIMLIEDHINFMGVNPLIGANDGLGTRFPDMSDCYSIDLQQIAIKCADELNMDLKKGVYFATSGPSYETAAEVRAYKMLGADVVGMSTVPEVIVASYLNLKTVAFSVITNYATGISENKLSHNEVIETGKTTSQKLTALIKNFISKL